MGSGAVTCAVTLIRDMARTLDLRGVRDIFRFRPRPPRFTLQKSQPMRLAFLFSGGRTVLVSALFLVSGFLHQNAFRFLRFSRTNTLHWHNCHTDTNQRVHRASVPAMPAETITTGRALVSA